MRSSDWSSDVCSSDLQGDWGVGIHERFDLVLINPPYISTQANLPHDVVGHEPHGALFSGSDGLNDYRRIAPELSALLKEGGMAAIEIGFDQGESAARGRKSVGEGQRGEGRVSLGGRRIIKKNKKKQNQET